MHEHCARPIILPMSNPTVLAEQTPANLLAWTDGAALVATGSPFGPVERDGTTYRIGQANNALMFPGLGLGVIVCRAATMPPSLFIAAARALAKLANPTDPAQGLLPDISQAARGLGHGGGRRRQRRHRPGHRAGPGRRPDRGRPRGDVDARVPPDPALTTRARTEHRSSSMAQTVAEILIDQMVEAGIRKVYGIVGDSANPIVDALRRHESDIEFVHVRNEEAGAFAAGADAQISGRPTAVLGSSGPGQPAPGQRAVRLPAQRARRSSRSRPTSPAPRSAAATSRRPTPRRSSPAARTTAPWSPPPGQMPRVSELALQAAILERGVGMIILPGDIAAQTVEHAMLRAPDPHRPAGDPTRRRGPREGGGADLRREEDRDPRRRGHPERARRGAPALGDPEGTGLVRLPRQGRARGRQPVRRSG